MIRATPGSRFLGLRDHELRRRREAPNGDLAGIFIAEGDLVVERALRAGYRLLEVLVGATRQQPPRSALPRRGPRGAAGPEVVMRITGMAMHRGLIASLDRGPDRCIDDVLAAATRAVVLENVNNPTNLGVIARSAMGLGIDALLLDPSCCDPLYRRASRVAMGEVFASRGPAPPGSPRASIRSSTLGSRCSPSPPILKPKPSTSSPSNPTSGWPWCSGPKDRASPTTRWTGSAEGCAYPAPWRRLLNVGAAAAIACYVLGRGRP
ncbi:MAG: TrmH family RNA methyltransferase [Acidimicrobiales bacterium]